MIPKINIIQLIQNLIKFSYKISMIESYKKPIHPRMGFLWIYHVPRFFYNKDSRQFQLSYSPAFK